MKRRASTCRSRSSRPSTRAAPPARRATTNGHVTLFDVLSRAPEGDTFEEGWRNKLIWGDNLLVMGSLLEQFAGKIDLIYIDPPFATGADFSFKAPIGESGDSAPKEASVIEEKAYRDTWRHGISSYLSMIHSRLHMMRSLLSETGSIYIHIGVDVAHAVKIISDEISETKVSRAKSYGTIAVGPMFPIRTNKCTMFCCTMGRVVIRRSIELR